MTQAVLLARSSDYATPPWGDEQQARFINACIEIDTSLDPHALLFTLHKIETKFGRDRANERRWGPRTLDLDLIAYDDVSIQEAGADAAAPPPVRTRLRAGAAYGNRAGPRDRRTQRRVSAGAAFDRRNRAVARPRLSPSGVKFLATRSRQARAVHYGVARQKQPFGLAARPVAISAAE